MAVSSLARVPVLPAMNAVTLLRALVKRPQRPAPSTLPDITTEFQLSRLPVEDIARYRAAFGFAGGHVPLSWWYLIAQRAHLATMLLPAFPFRIVGLVHMENALVEHSRADDDQPLQVRTVLHLLPPSSSGALRCVFETTGSATAGPVFTCTSTYLVKRGARRDAPRPGEPGVAAEAKLAQWTLDASAGRRYARLSGDWNPIHLSPWSARLMGMGAPIIHGAHTLAMACAALENHAGTHATAIDCRFRGPVALGSSVTLRFVPGPGEFIAEVATKPAVTGRVTLA